MPEQSRKPVVFIVAYWHDSRFKKKTGGLLRIFDLGTNLKRSGLNAHLFVPRIGNPKRQTSARVMEIPFIDLPVFRPLSFQFNLMIILLVASFRAVDFLYVRQMNSFVPHIVAKLRNLPIIYEIPNDPYIPARTLRSTKRALIRRIDKICLSLADRVVVLSAWSKERLIIRERVPAEKIHVLVSGSDCKLFRPLPRLQCCQKTRIDPNCRYIGFVGTFLSHQGIETLIEAAPNVVKADNAAKFLLVGDGPMRSAWEKLAERFGMKERFIFTGHVPYAQVPFYLGTMEICVAPFRKGSNQASPVKLFDYMACGKPIVASDLPAVREVIGDSGCAVLVPADRAEALSKAIIELLADEFRQRAMADTGRKLVVEKYNRTAIAGDLITIGKDIIARGSRCSQ